MCHLGHEYLHNIALETADILGINVITGAQVKGSTLPDVVFDTYEYLIENFYPEGRVILNNIRIPPIYGGPKEAFLQATVLQNAGFVFLGFFVVAFLLNWRKSNLGFALVFTTVQSIISALSILVVIVLVLLLLSFLI